jgi:cell division protein FtsN
MKEQRSGILLGFIIGVVVGLGIALIVAMYVSKVPVPFFNKSQTRTPEQDAAEQKKNKDWDPNAPLQGKSAAKPGAGASGSATNSPSAPPAVAKPLPKPAVTADPLGDLAKAKGAAATAEPFSYFVQVGAFRTPEDAESQRARLSLTGVEAKVTEREQAGRTVYRVRVGPFEQKDEAESTKRKLDAAGYETALVRQQR